MYLAGGGTQNIFGGNSSDRNILRNIFYHDATSTNRSIISDMNIFHNAAIRSDIHYLQLLLQPLH